SLLCSITHTATTHRSTPSLHDALPISRGQLVAVVPVELTDRDHRAGLTVRDLQRSVAHLTGLLPEDRAQQPLLRGQLGLPLRGEDRKSTRLNSSHVSISYAVFCLKTKR